MLVVGALVTGMSVGARPLQRSDVAADAVWVVHLDFDGLKPTVIGQYILEQMNTPEARARLAAFQAVFSFDPRTQLHGVTLYGTGSAPEDGVLVVYADFDPSRLVTLARAAKDSQQTAYRQHTIYSWMDEHKKRRDGGHPRTYAAIDGARVVFGQRENRVSQALDVLDGATPSLASTRLFPQLGAVGDTSFIEAAARRMDFAQFNANAAVFRLAKYARFQLKEVGKQVSATLTLEATDEEIAANMASIGQGLIALMKLQKDKPESTKLAQVLSLKQEGPQVVVTARLPADEVLGMLKAAAAHKARKEAQKEN